MQHRQRGRGPRARKKSTFSNFFIENVTELSLYVVVGRRSGHDFLTDFYLVNKTCTWFVISKPVTRNIAKSVITFFDNHT